MSTAMRRLPALRACLVMMVLLMGQAYSTRGIAQSQDQGRLLIVVTDPSGSVIPAARVTVTSPAPASVPRTSTTLTDGSAVFEALTPGRYTLRAEFDGFEPVEILGYRVRAGSNRRVLSLPIRRIEEGVSVGRERRDAMLDPGGSAFSTILTRDQIDALPDDPEEMAAVLQAMSPPGSRFRVDGFSGGRLPPRSQIRAIRLPRLDQFAAQNHGGMAGALFIDISTQPGGGVLGGSVETTWRDDALHAANPFATEKGNEYLRRGGISFGGPIVANRSSFSVDYGATRQLDAGLVLAALPDGFEGHAIGQATGYSTFGARFDQAFGAHLMQASVRSVATSQDNLGIGAYDLPERAYGVSSRNTTLRLSQNGPLGRNTFLETRFQAEWQRATAVSGVEMPTVRVLDAFTAGGAQRAGGTRAFAIETAADVDRVHGAHSYRAGMVLEAARHRSDLRTNYLGTFTFSSLSDYEARQPSLYTQQAGNPLIRYSNLQLGAYVQDDYRIARSLLLSYGIRYEGQSTGGDWLNLGPRATLAWAPAASGRTTIRAAWGHFSDWLETGVYEQSLRLDGTRQHEVVVSNPGYPEPGTAGGTPLPGWYRLDANNVLPRTRSWSVGFDHALTNDLRLSLSYTNRSSSHLLRGTDDNAPVHGVRPVADHGEMIRAVDDSAQRARLVGASATFAKTGWRRLFAGASYTYAVVESNTTGAFALPASGNIAEEWGATTPRHRFAANFTMRPLAALSLAVNARAQSGSPYTITTGRDGNGDGQFNDRPFGTPRATEWTAPHWDIGGRVSYAVGFGGSARGTSAGGDRVAIRIGRGGGLEGGYDGGAEASRYRVEFYLSAQNVTNHHNYTGYSGVLTSPFFGQPTDVLNPRKVEIGVRLGF